MPEVYRWRERRERRSRERPSGRERDAQGDVRCVPSFIQAADNGVAAMASQDSDGSELELAMKYSEVLAEMDDEDDRVLNALSLGAGEGE